MQNNRKWDGRDLIIRTVKNDRKVGVLMKIKEL